LDPSTEAPRAPLRRSDKFDMLRGIGALAVLVAHAVGTCDARIIGPEHRVVLLAGTIARHAVLALFLLSGYLIT
jgi:peptidoglycan/LPS O-acetylase OafA/YrhL